jgi:hypothetical protein
MPAIAFRRLAAALVTIVLAGACDRAPTAPAAAAPAALASFDDALVLAADGQGAEREVREELFDLEGSLVSYPCGLDGGYTEQIALTGKVFMRLQTVDVPGGGFHVVVHSMPVGLSGVGLTSGATYRVVEREHIAFQSTPMATTSSYQSTLRFSAPEIGVHGRLVIGGRFTVDANGELVVERPILRGECRA